MRTKKEIRLKSLSEMKEILNKIIEAEIQKLTKELVLSQKISLWEKPNHSNILEVLQDVLNHTSFRWVDLEIYFLIKTKKPILYPRRTKTKIFVFGNRKFIIENIEEIAGRIMHRKVWTAKEAGISPEHEFSIEDFI